MENQGNMQSRKKAAVIYFLAAFFIACIGIAEANYLKGELGLSAEELVKKVELTVEIAVLLGIAIAVRHLLKKRNRKYSRYYCSSFCCGSFFMAEFWNLAGKPVEAAAIRNTGK